MARLRFCVLSDATGAPCLSSDVRHHKVTPSMTTMTTRNDITSGWLGLGLAFVVLLGVGGHTARAAEGYAAIGHLTYTSFDAAAKPAAKEWSCST